MVIYADTRQKKDKHIRKHSQIEKAGFELQHKALKTGDYMIEGNDRISVDTKASLNEVYSNIINDKSRFMKEVRRAREQNIKLIVLIEHGGIKSLQDVAKWNSKYGNISGRELMERMYRIHIAYGAEFLFCDKRVTGKKIIELLTGAGA